ncbi:MAG: site-2 protease family protein, partial [Acetanaerobacterium sp.]
FHEELVMLLAGPAANILLFFLCSTSSSQTVSLIAAVNLSIGIFNLLPVGSLDGGRVASLVSAHLLGEQKGRLAALILSIVILTVLLAAGVWLLLMPNRNFSLLVVCVFLALSLVMDLRARGERVIL